MINTGSHPKPNKIGKNERRAGTTALLAEALRLSVHPLPPKPTDQYKLFSGGGTRQALLPQFRPSSVYVRVSVKSLRLRTTLTRQKASSIIKKLLSNTPDTNWCKAAITTARGEICSNTGSSPKLS